MKIKKPRVRDTNEESKQRKEEEKKTNNTYTYNTIKS